MAIKTEPIEALPGFKGILNDQEVYAVADGDEFSRRLNNWFDRLIVRAGLDVSPTVILLLSLLAGMALGGIVFVFQEDLLSTAIMAVLGFLIPLAAVMILQSRRQSQMMQQLPAMIDELARAARTGRSLDQCLQVIAQDTPQPLGRELQRSVRKLQLGIGVSEALRDLPERTGLFTLSILVTALKVHQQTGGDLVHVLERLAQTVRDRLLFMGRLRSATITSRATAVLMIVLPPLILAFFMFRDPNHFPNLMAATWGRRLTILAVGLQIVGSIWVLRILKSSART